MGRTYTSSEKKIGPCSIVVKNFAPMLHADVDVLPQLSAKPWQVSNSVKLTACPDKR
jgi:hypothetical protein